MRLELVRIALRPQYTIGRLYVDGERYCDTLEDTVRDLNRNGRFDAGEVKIPDHTAIPYGSYKVTMGVVSPKYSQRKFYRDNCHGGRVPRLLDVPHFDGILIHCGNSHVDTSGCILVGRNTEVGRLTQSQATFLPLYNRLWAAHQRGESITITIR